MPGGWEAGHVGTDLSEDHLGATSSDPGDRHQERHRRFVGVQQLVDPLSQLRDRGVGLVDACQHRPTQQGVVLVEPPSHRVLQGGDLRTHPSLGHLREHHRIALSRDQGVDHLPPRLGQHTRRHAGELHAGVFEDLVQPLRLPGPFLDHRLAVAGQIPQRPERFGWDETRSHQAVLKQRRTPDRIRESVLRPGRVLHLTSRDGSGDLSDRIWVRGWPS